MAFSGHFDAPIVWSSILKSHGTLDDIYLQRGIQKFQISSISRDHLFLSDRNRRSVPKATQKKQKESTSFPVNSKC